MAEQAPGGATATGGFPAAVELPGGETAERRLGWRRVLLLVSVIGGIAVCAVAVLVWLGFNIGPDALAIGLVSAILPVPILVACFLWLDRYEPEPVKYLIFCFCWGAFVATLISLAVNNAAAWLFERQGLSLAFVAVFVAPFIEETTKALGPVLLAWRRRREFSGITDGIVYCGLSATGFAMVENILYLGGHGYAANADEYGPASGAQAVIAVFIVRIFLSGFAHPLFTAMAGVGLGFAARSADRRTQWAAPVAGLLGAMMLHGAWNFAAMITQQTRQPLIFAYHYFAVMVPIFLAVVGLAIWLRSWEGRLTERVLPVYVRTGWFSPPEIAALGTLSRRHAARAWARRVAGPGGFRAMRAYQFAATELALLRDRMQRGLDRRPADVRRSLDEERQLLGAVDAYRRVFSGRDPQAPPVRWDGQRYWLSFPDGRRRPVDPPAEPVVPLPMVLSAPAPGPGGYPAPGSGGYPAPGPGGGWHGPHPPPVAPWR
ncbi:MAG TPA: PrsW family intramembrane metalloprotease [Pilimelia sp.]|nr:PrsW family intramembrane metalloprotease [Pilimelia sp.]